MKNTNRLWKKIINQDSYNGNNYKKKKLKKKKPRMNNPKLKILKLEKKMEIFLKFYGIPWSD